MTRETLTARIALDGGKEIKAELEALGNAGKKAFQQLQEAAAKVQTPAVRFSAALTKLRTDLVGFGEAGVVIGKDLAAVGKGFDQIGTNARKVATNIGLIAAAAAGAAAAVVKFATSGAQASVQITNQAQALGLTTGAYQDLQAVARETELEQGQFERLISRFTIELGENAAKMGASTKKAGKDVREFGEDVFDTGVKISSLAKGFTDKERAEKAAKKTTDASTLSLKALGVTTTENGEALVAYAKKIASIEDPLQRLAIVSQDFGRKQALSIVPFLLAINQNIEKTGKIAGDAVPALSDLELAVGLKLDDSLDKLGTTAERTKLRLQLLFAGPLEAGVSAFDDLIRRNQQTILAWGQSISQQALPVVNDLIAAISGRDADVVNPAILKWRDEIRAVIADVRGAAQAVADIISAIIPAADGVAKALNGLFGTELSGRQLLLIAVVGQLIGVFRLFGSVLRAASAGGKLLFDVLRGIGALGGVIGNLIRVLVTGAGALTSFVAGLVGLPALVVAGIAAALIAAGVAIFVFWDDIKAAALAAWEAIKQGASDAVAALGEDWQHFADTFDALVWEPLKTAASDAWTAVSGVVQDALDGLVGLVTNIGADIADALADPAETLEQLWNAAVDAVLGKLDDLLDGAKAVFDDLVAFAKRAARAIADAFDSAGDAAASTSTEFSGFAGGGLIGGRGTGTSDSNLAWVSKGEFVLRAAAVRKYGLGLIAALNSLRLPRSVVATFSDGGLVAGLGRALAGVGPIPAYAGGGLVSAPSLAAPGRPLSITIDGQTFAGLLAPADVAEELTRFAMRRQLRSAGQKPGWYGGGR